MDEYLCFSSEESVPDNDSCSTHSSTLSYSIHQISLTHMRSVHSYIHSGHTDTHTQCEIVLSTMCTVTPKNYKVTHYH